MTTRAELDARTAGGRCVCCGLAHNVQWHHGQPWCGVCVGRDHHEDGPANPADPTTSDPTAEGADQ